MIALLKVRWREIFGHLFRGNWGRKRSLGWLLTFISFFCVKNAKFSTWVSCNFHEYGFFSFFSLNPNAFFQLNHFVHFDISIIGVFCHSIIVRCIIILIITVSILWKATIANRRISLGAYIQTSSSYEGYCHLYRWPREQPSKSFFFYLIEFVRKKRRHIMDPNSIFAIFDTLAEPSLLKQ